MGRVSSGNDQVFRWSPERTAAAYALAEGKTRAEAAAAAGVDERTVYTWLGRAEFSEEVDRLTLLTGIAIRAERLRVVKRIVAKLDGQTEKDLLEWLKFAQSETDGARSDIADKLAALFAAYPGARDAVSSHDTASGDPAS